jgi:prophage regulatory protein
MNFLTLGEVRSRVKLSKVTIYRKVKAGTFPAQYELSANRVGWKESEIDAWCESRVRSNPRVRVVRLPVSLKRF